MKPGVRRSERSAYRRSCLVMSPCTRAGVDERVDEGADEEQALAQTPDAARQLAGEDRCHLVAVFGAERLRIEMQQRAIEQHHAFLAIWKPLARASLTSSVSRAASASRHRAVRTA